MGCFLALAVVSGSRNGQLGYLAAVQATNWLEAVASNQSYAAYIVADFHSGQNSLQKDPIVWSTVTSVSTKPVSLAISVTNFLKP